MAKQTPPTSEVSNETAAEVTAALLNAVHELFGDTATEVTLPSTGIVCKFFPAKFRHIEELSVLFESMVADFENQEILTLVNTVSKNQEELIKQGQSPYLIDTQALVREAASNQSLASRLLRKCAQTLPKLAPMFTSLTDEEFRELDADEALIVAMGLFSRNYNFFIQRLLPVIVAFAESRVKKS